MWTNLPHKAAVAHTPAESPHELSFCVWGPCHGWCGPGDQYVPWRAAAFPLISVLLENKARSPITLASGELYKKKRINIEP